jgi:hypothetical protein
MRPVLVALMALLMCFTGRVAPAQQPVQTLRTAIRDAGFPLPAALPPSDLNREWNSNSSWDADATYFAAAVYFEDERRDAMHLGPLHLIRLAKSGEVIRHSLREDDGLRLGGSPGVDITPPYVLIHSHVSPSAGLTLVLDASFTPVASLFSLGTDVLADGTILYEEGLVHFADAHQQKLRLFDPATKADREVYPGSAASPFGTRVLQRIRRAQQDISREFGVELSPGEEIKLFDRSFEIKQISADGRAVAFAVWYGSMKFIGQYDGLRSYRPVLGPKPEVPDPSFSTVVRCRRDAAQSWACDERLAEDVARAHKLALPRGWQDEDPDAAKLLDAVLRESAPKPQAPSRKP